MAVKTSKKGLFFTIDAILSVSLLLGVLLLITQFYVVYQPRSNLDYLSSDMADVLNEITVGEINNAFVQQKIADGNITRLNNSILNR